MPFEQRNGENQENRAGNRFSNTGNRYGNQTGNQQTHRPEQNQDHNFLPTGYLKEGYFTEKGFLREKLVTTFASQIARDLGYASPAMTSGQLRRFFQHVRGCEKVLGALGEFERIRAEVKKLEHSAKEAQGKGKIPVLFTNFIEKNLELVNDEKSFRAFLDHFQAIVAYFTYHHPKKN